MAWTLKKTACVIGGTVVGGIVIAATGGLAAPAIGAAIGTGMRLSGAAATSAGLAALGGGALAAGGGGMAAGGAAIVSAGAAAGAIAGTAGGIAASAALDDHKKCKVCKAVINPDSHFCPQCGAKFE